MPLPTPALLRATRELFAEHYRSANPYTNTILHFCDGCGNVQFREATHRKWTYTVHADCDWCLR